MSKKPILKVTDLCKYFPVVSGLLRRITGNFKAVDGVSFEVREGEILGLVGESGSGKSTTARAAIRLMEPTSGKIEYQGKDYLALSKKELAASRREIQIVFQDPYASLNPRRSIFEAIGEGLIFHDLANGPQDTLDQVVDILETVGLSADALHKYPHEFSGGQQQRICIGRAVALKPKLLVCDEAVSALDVSIQAQILNLLAELKDKLGMSYLFISHDLGVVRHLCDRVLVMLEGKIIEEGSAESLFQNPQHPYTQGLLQAIPPDYPVKK